MRRGWPPQSRASDIKDPGAALTARGVDDPVEVDVGRVATPAPERFWPKVQKTDTCWLWAAGLDSNGYGRFAFITAPRQSTIAAHRYSYEQLVGPIPDDLVLDHLCRVRNCVNPAHLEPVTNRENVLRGETVAAYWARQTHCQRGHDYSYRDGGKKRYCRTCANDAARAAGPRKRPRKVVQP